MTRRVQCGRRTQRQSRLDPGTQEHKGRLYMTSKRFLDSKVLNHNEHDGQEQARSPNIVLHDPVSPVDP